MGEVAATGGIDFAARWREICFLFHAALETQAALNKRGFHSLLFSLFHHSLLYSEPP